MPKLTASSFQSHLTAQENSEAARVSVDTLEPVTASLPLEGEWRRAIRIAKTLAKWPLYTWALLVLLTLASAAIRLLTNSLSSDYIYSGTFQFVLGSIIVGTLLPLNERSLLLAGVTSREIWRISMIFACATTALTAISMGEYAIIDITAEHPGNVMYIIHYVGITPFLWLLAPLGVFPGSIASACVGIANRYLSSGSAAAVIVLTILLMNPFSFLIIPHALGTGLPGYVIYLLVAAVAYPLLLRFILSRPRNEK